MSVHVMSHNGNIENISALDGIRIMESECISENEDDFDQIGEGMVDTQPNRN